MIIENSAFYKTSVDVRNTENLNSENSNDTSTSLENEEFSFWDWFKGLVNPLQNLPIISGIYSSVNSEDENSDRDLVQNSLGGFLYGGPIGAIAGFGNWVFNKIFDRTPTELALDFTGVSEIWKDDGDSEKVANVSDQDIKTTESQVFSFFNNGRQIKKRNNYNTDISKIRSQEKNVVFSKINDSSSEFAKIKPQKIVNLSEVSDNSPALKKIQPQEIIKLSEVNDNLPKLKKMDPQETVGLSEISDNLPKLQEIKPKKSETSNDYRQINFSYPIWKPEVLNKGLNGKLDMSKSKEKYLNLENKTHTSQTLDIDA